jgi:glycine oxidase
MIPTGQRVAVVGAGIAGLFTAWQLARRGVPVTLFDQHEPGQGCTRRAAGMLAPINELEFQELELLHAGIASRGLYDDVEAQLGDIGMVRSGTLEVGLTQDDQAWLRRLFEFQQAQGLPVEWIKGDELRDREPYLSAQIRNAIWSPQDVQVDHLLLVKRLVEDLAKRGVELRFNTPVAMVMPNGVASTPAGEERFAAVVLCTGVAVGQKIPFRVYPVRGEMVSLAPPFGEFLKHTVRIRNKVLGAAYVVPKAGRILVGSTSEEKGFEQVNTAGGVMDILRKAYAAVPGLYELPLIETWAGLRPSTLNRMPVVDREGDTKVYHVNGLFRHGILLGPLLGLAAAELILTGRRMPEIESFRIPASFGS